MPEQLTRLKGLHIDRVAFVERGDNPKADVLLWKSYDYSKANYSAAQRATMAGKGEAIPIRNAAGDIVDGSFPIPNVAALKDAIRAIGRAKDPAAAKAHIVSRAKSLGSSDLIPDGWTSKSEPTSGEVHVDTLGAGKPAPKKKQKPTPWVARRDSADASYTVTTKAEDESAESYGDRISEVSSAWYAKSNPSSDSDVSQWVREVYPDHIIVSDNGQNFTVPYAENADGNITFDMTAKAAVEQTWVAAKSDPDAGDRKEGTVPNREDLPSDLPEEVTKYLDAIEAERDEAVKKAEEAAKTEPEKETESELEKSLKDADPVIKAALLAAEERTTKAEATAQAAKDEVEKLRVEKADEASVAKAKALKFLALKPEEIGPMLRKLADADPDLAAKVEQALTSANATANEAFKEIGKGGESEAGGSALEKLDVLAKAHADVHKIDIDQARTVVVETPEGRALMAEYEDERLEEVRG